MKFLQNDNFIHPPFHGEIKNERQREEISPYP